jgi:cullin 3
MAPYIEERGEKIVKDETIQKDPIKFTSELLNLKKEMDELVEKSFLNDIRFQKNRDVAFQNFMNKCNLTANYIAAYCDNEFRRGLKGVSEAETHERLDAIIRLFCCLFNRDVFIKSYTKYLSARLLNKQFLSKDAEEQMLQKLKVECGHNTVNKISQMFTDMTLSKDLMDNFKTHALSKSI